MTLATVGVVMACGITAANSSGPMPGKSKTCRIVADGRTPPANVNGARRSGVRPSVGFNDRKDRAKLNAPIARQEPSTPAPDRFPPRDSGKWTVVEVIDLKCRRLDSPARHPFCTRISGVFAGQKYFSELFGIFGTGIQFAMSVDRMTRSSTNFEVTVERIDLLSRLGEATTLLCSFFWSNEFGLRCSIPGWLTELESTGIATPGGKVYPTEGRRFFDALKCLVNSVVDITAPRHVPMSEIGQGS